MIRSAPEAFIFGKRMISRSIVPGVVKLWLTVVDFMIFLHAGCYFGYIWTVVGSELDLKGIHKKVCLICGYIILSIWPIKRMTCRRFS